MSLKTEIDDAIEAYRRAKSDSAAAAAEVDNLQFQLEQARNRARTAADKFDVAHRALFDAIGSPEDAA